MNLDALMPQQRREFYRRLDLTVVANRDKSLTLRWFFDVEMEVLRCQEKGTSRRSFSSANPPRLRFVLISRDGGLKTTFELDHNTRGGCSK